MQSLLVEIAEQYIANKARLHALEGKTAIMSLTARTVNDQRHTLDHVLLGVLANSRGDEGEAEYMLRQAKEHQRESILNAFEIIAGKALSEAQSALEKAGIFNSTGNSKAYFDQATQFYAYGRDARTADQEAALGHFENAAVKAIESRFAIGDTSPARRFRFWWIIIIGLITAGNIAYNLIF